MTERQFIKRILKAIFANCAKTFEKIASVNHLSNDVLRDKDGCCPIVSALPPSKREEADNFHTHNAAARLLDLETISDEEYVNFLDAVDCIVSAADNNNYDRRCIQKATRRLLIERLVA